MRRDHTWLAATRPVAERCAVEADGERVPRSIAREREGRLMRATRASLGLEAR